MAKKIKKEIKPSPQPQFHTSAFASLKTLAVEKEQPEPLPAKKKSSPDKTFNENGDEELFAMAMTGVRLLDENSPSKKKRIATGESFKTTNQSTVPKPALPREQITAKKDFLKEVEKLKLDVRFEDQSYAEDEIKALSGNRLRQLKRGIVSLDRQLDLHGLTREEALRSLSDFIDSARRSGEKAVLVITGKGNRSSGPPVLQQAVAGWLREQGRSMVIEFAPAPQAMGGSGAFAVFLRPLDKPAIE